MLAEINLWFLSLGEQYGVNPYVFGAIYVGERNTARSCRY